MAERQKDDSVLIDQIKLDEEKSDEILAKYDREFAFRRLEGPVAKFVFLLAVAWSLAHLYTAAFGVFPPRYKELPTLVLPWYLYLLCIRPKEAAKAARSHGMITFWPSLVSPFRPTT